MAFLMLSMEEAAERVDRCLHSFVHAHQKPDALRQDLIQELMVVYERGVRDERAAHAAQQEKLPKTEIQAKVLQYVRDFKARRGFIPSYLMIARHIGVSSKATIAKHIGSLRKQGFDL